ncbi:MAG: cbb3-type cytochrome c oxidase subunit I [Anaerolineae bacterium]
MSMFKRENSAAVFFIMAASTWLVFGVLMGLTLALELVFPDLGHGVSFLVYSRLRQAHVNTVMFAWLSGGMMGLWLYIIPRLTGRKLWSEVLGNISALLWNVAVVACVIGILMGISQGREYAEMVYVVDVGVMIVLILNCINLYMTIAHRTEPKLYVSVWYIIGTLIWMPALYFIGNIMWNPPTGALTGLDDAIFNWFYGHNVLGLWFTTGLIAVMYYVVPKETHVPIYSHALSLIAFWGIAIFYTGVGAHHLLWAPIPYWLRTIAVAESIGLILPVAAFMANIGFAMRGNWNKALTSIPLRFVLTGWASYILVSYQGTHQALRSINLLTHFTQYVPSHAHLSLLFFAASTVMGGAYFILPRIFNCRLFSRRLANVQYVLYFIGFTAFFMGFLLTGIVQGTNWVHQGLPIWSVLPGMRPFMALRATGGALVVTSFIMFTYNAFATIAYRRPVETPELELTPSAAGRMLPAEQ